MVLLPALWGGCLAAGSVPPQAWEWLRAPFPSVASFFSFGHPSRSVGRAEGGRTGGAAMGTLCLPPLLGVFTLGRGGWEPPETETSKKKKGKSAKSSQLHTLRVQGARRRGAESLERDLGRICRSCSRDRGTGLSTGSARGAALQGFCRVFGSTHVSQGHSTAPRDPWGTPCLELSPCNVPRDRVLP